MTGWKIRRDAANYAGLILKVEQDIGFLNTLRKPMRILPHWTPLAVQYNRSEYSEGIKINNPPQIGGSNFPGLYHFQAWDKHAVDALLPLIAESIEALPLISADGEFYLMNVVQVVDCLDYERSTVRRAHSSERVTGVDHYVFKDGCLEGKHIFRMREDNYSVVYVSDAFKAVAEKAGLIGLHFDKVWD